MSDNNNIEEEEDSNDIRIKRLKEYIKKDENFVCCSDFKYNIQTGFFGLSQENKLVTINLTDDFGEEYGLEIFFCPWCGKVFNTRPF